MTAKDGKRRDLFAGIAAQGAAGTRGTLIEPLPLELPAWNLPGGRSNPQAAFKPLAKLDTPAKLQRALERERRRMAPFLRNLAPAPATDRIAVALASFDWRLETAADRQDFQATLQGAGAWETVTIPHYGGPVGRAVSYYRTTFEVTPAMVAKGSLWLCFKGVDYRTHAFVNGTFLGSHEGFFAPFEFDFTPHAREGRNVLVVKVENDAAPICDGGSWGMKVDGDKLYAATGPGWDDPELGWHHCPPGMGIYQAVTVEARPTLHLADVFVRPLIEGDATGASRLPGKRRPRRIASPGTSRVELWIEVFNGGLEPEGVRFQVSVFGQNFKATLFRDRVYEPPQKAGPRLNRYRFAFDIPKPRLWDLDTPWLYQVQVRLMNGDSRARQFGLREFRMEDATDGVDATPPSHPGAKGSGEGAASTEDAAPLNGRFLLNGREIRLRGANTMGFEQQDVMRGDLDQLRDDILLAKLCHMNFWRLTQRPVQPEVYELCDRLGFMTQTDLPLFGFLPRRQFCEAVRQAEEMERLVRNHPCNILVSYINEPFPAAWGDKTHRQCGRDELERFFTAASEAVRLANPDRMIKPVDGDYDLPGPGLPDNHCYTCWYNGHGVELGKLNKGYWQRVKPGWFYGCGEFGAEGLDFADLMRRRYPAAWLPQTPEEEGDWTPDRIKDAQSGRFHYMFFDTQRTLDGWVAASQRHQAWATRIMTEAFRRDRRMNTFAIHLFIDAWPSGWMKTIMDCERRPKPAYFAYREALTPLMANIRTDRWAFAAGEAMRFEFWVCNDTHEIPARARLRYQLEIGGKAVFAQQAKARVEACTSTFQGFVELPAPSVKARTAAVLRLALCGGDDTVLHDTAVELTLFPAVPAAEPQARVTVIGARDGKAARLARELGLKARFVLKPFINRQSYQVQPLVSAPRSLGEAGPQVADCQAVDITGCTCVLAKPGSCSRGADETRPVILIDDPALFAARRAAIEAAVLAGATAIFLELPTGEHRIGGDAITMEPCGMGPRHFASRATGHPLVEGFAPEDFRLWHDPAVDRVAPLLETCFRADGWTPILTTGSGGGTLPSPTAWSPALAAAEKREGAGRWCICQVALAGRTATNPVAREMARRLFT